MVEPGRSTKNAENIILSNQHLFQSHCQALKQNNFQIISEKISQRVDQNF